MIRSLLEEHGHPMMLKHPPVQSFFFFFNLQWISTWKQWDLFVLLFSVWGKRGGAQVCRFCIGTDSWAGKKSTINNICWILFFCFQAASKTAFIFFSQRCCGTSDLTEQEEHPPLHLQTVHNDGETVCMSDCCSDRLDHRRNRGLREDTSPVGHLLNETSSSSQLRSHDSLCQPIILSIILLWLFYLPDTLLRLWLAPRPDVVLFPPSLLPSWPPVVTSDPVT